MAKQAAPTFIGWGGFVISTHHDTLFGWQLITRVAYGVIVVGKQHPSDPIQPHHIAILGIRIDVEMIFISKILNKHRYITQIYPLFAIVDI